MNDLREAIELVQETAVQASGVDVIPLNLRHKKMISHGGAQSLVDLPVPPREHIVKCIDSLATALSDSPHASVWHDDDSIVAICDDSAESHRDDRIQLPLKRSEKFNYLTVKAAVPRPHLEFVHSLVQNLRDELDAAAPGLLGTIRNLKFRTRDEQDGHVQHGRESMGRQVDAEASGAADLPETIVFKVRRWAALEFVATVEVALVIDLQDRNLSLRPLADQMEQAEQDAQAWLHDQLAGAVEGATVYHGTP